MSTEATATAQHEGHVVHRDDEGSKTGMWLFLFTELLLFGGLFLVLSDTLARTVLAPRQLPVGVVTTLIPQARFDPDEAVALVCGPEVMMRFTIQELQRRGVTSDRIFLSMERNMKCGVGCCGHCQLGGSFVCKDGPVFAWPEIRPLLGTRGY